MEISQEQYREMLVPPGHLTEDQFVSAYQAAEEKGVSLADELLNEGLISDANLGRTIADYFDCHFIDLQDRVLKEESVEIIPEIVARSQRAVVYEVTEDSVHVATEKVDNYEFFRLLEKKTGKEPTITYATERGIDTALKYYKGDLREQIQKLINLCEENPEDGSVVQLVNLFLEYAHDNRSSDIHIEPLKDSVAIRFRIDGVLHVAVRYPKSLHEKVVFRIKILSHIQTDEHAAAQDGRFEYQHDKSVFDVRVSILPVSDGENVVMRLLDSESHRFSLENLGLSGRDYMKVSGAIKDPHGMILTVGPTGSGKTTVLYAVLEKLNSPEVNIMTIEDPIEYSIEGVQQTQVNPKKNLTFATGLRSIVRQDPDMIMVGEIRDEETADIAVNSALTGHLVLSTLHTNDAATVFPRLIEMGVEPFLIASSVNLIISLRLVRKICAHCKESYVLTEQEIDLISQNEIVLKTIEIVSGGKKLEQLRLFKGRGCRVCQNTGFSGRMGIFEVLKVSENIRPLVTGKESADVIAAKAFEEGMVPMLQDGLQKALNGSTTIDEVVKVAGG